MNSEVPTNNTHEKKQTAEDLIDALHKLRKSKSRVNLHIEACKHALKCAPDNTYNLLGKLRDAHCYMHPTDCKLFVVKAISLMEELNESKEEEMHNIINRLAKKL